MEIDYRICNFKAFRDTGKLHFAPITVLCGENSSGKSSIIQSLLLLRQSVSERRSQFVANATPSPLLFNGELARLGSWTEIVNYNNRNTPIRFEWSISGLRDPKARSFKHQVTMPYGRRRRRKEFQYDLAITLRSEGPTAVELGTIVHDIFLKIGQKTVIKLRWINNDIFVANVNDISALFTDDDTLDDILFQYNDVLKIVNILRETSSEFTTGHLRAIFTGPFPARILRENDQSWIETFENVSSLLHKSRVGKRGPVPKFIGQFDAELAALKNRDKAGHEDKIVRRRLNMTGNISLYIAQQIEGFICDCVTLLAPLLRDIRYLGPLREQPRRYYQFDDTGGVDIGVSGEFTTQVLALEASTPVTASMLSYDKDGQIHLKDATETTLVDATNTWLQFMGLPIVEPECLRQSLYQLKVATKDGLRVTLPDVGFGVSQILPLIVESLRAKKGETVILEQPEIHLHPKIQAVLADFFIARARDGVRFLIESHSEYLVKRLCRRIAESTVPDVESLVNIQFISRDTEFESVCRSVELNEFGEIRNWPAGFFDSVEDLYWTNASLKKRRIQKERTASSK